MKYHVLTFKLTQGFSLPLESKKKSLYFRQLFKTNTNSRRLRPAAQQTLYSLLIVKTLENILEKFAQAILELIRNGLNLKLIRLQRLKKYNILQYKTENEIEKLKKSVKFYTKIHIYTSLYRNSRFKQIIFSKYTQPI